MCQIKETPLMKKIIERLYEGFPEDQVNFTILGFLNGYKAKDGYKIRIFRSEDVLRIEVYKED